MTLAVDIQARRGTFSLTAAVTTAGGVTGVFGPSGSGKSTLLHAVTGLVRANTGTITLDGETLFDATAGISVPAHRRRIAAVFQDGRLLPHYTVAGNLRYGERLLHASERRIGFDEVVQLLELGALLERRVRGLSGGEAQRVALGRALLCSPRLLVLDEPLAALDDRLKAQIMAFLRAIRDRLEMPMLYVSHDLSEILQLTDRLALMERGRVLGQGRVLELARDPALQSLLQRHGLANVLPIVVARSDADGTLLTLASAGAERTEALHGPRSELAIGSRGSLTIDPRHIALATQRVAGISMRNQLRGRVVSVSATGNGSLVVVDVGVPLLCEVGQAAIAELGISAGVETWCLFKAQAIRLM